MSPCGGAARSCEEWCWRWCAARTDPARWKSAVRKTADRLGHLLAGERVPAADEPALASPLDEIRRSERALDLLRFGLGDVYPALRRDAEVDPS